MEIIADKYEVIRQLGAGGYGSVYLVRHRDLGLQFALKLLNRALSDDARLVDGFRQEAELLSRFSHKGSAQLRDFGRTADGLYYMTIDFCEGETLEEILRRDKWLPVLAALEITAQCLEVLAAAHQFGIIHRDVKPSNIIIQRQADGGMKVRVVDFGIATLVQRTDTDPSVPGEGYVVGTPQYMSPEQASGESTLDDRLDLYAMGVVLYEMLTGVPPFQGDSVVSILVKHLTLPAPHFAEQLGIPLEVEQVVLRALAKNPADRYQSADLFLKQCDLLLQKLLGAPAPEVTTGVHAAFITSAVAAAVQEIQAPAQPVILCLDDDAMVLNITQHILEREGYKVFTAMQFTEIHDIIFREGCRLMLCDVEMPGLSGTRICQMLKKSMPELTIILFSNVPERDLEKLARECGADSWLSKGKRPDEWLQHVKEMVARMQSREKH